MSISILRLLIDFGLVVLIWMTQLIIYPSFLHYTRENLLKWHRKYTPTVGYVAGPLMLVQLGVSMYQIYTVVTIYNSISLLMIIVIWILTFQQFVPIHTNISKGEISEKLLLSLVNKNWSRTILWTLIFMISFIAFVKA